MQSSLEQLTPRGLSETCKCMSWAGAAWVQHRGAGGPAALAQCRGVQWLAILMAWHRLELKPATQSGHRELTSVKALCFLLLVYIQSWELISLLCYSMLHKMKPIVFAFEELMLTRMGWDIEGQW